MAHADALRAAGVNGQAPANAGAIKTFVSAITDNALWLIGTIATLAIVVIGGLFFFGHSRAGRLRGQDRRRRGDRRLRPRHRRLGPRRAPAALSRTRARRAAALARRGSRSCCARAGWRGRRRARGRSVPGRRLARRRAQGGRRRRARAAEARARRRSRSCWPRSSARWRTCWSPRAWCAPGVDGIKWLVQLPPVGVDATPTAGRARGADAAPAASCATR